MIAIIPYQPSWPEDFNRICRDLQRELGELDIRIDHIGSTAVPGLPAKDKIVIQITVADLIPEVEDILVQLGYTRLGYLSDHLN